MYDSMILDLKRIHEVYMNRRGGSDFSWERKMTELVTSLLEYTAAKRDMTDLYPILSTLETLEAGCNFQFSVLPMSHTNCIRVCFTVIKVYCTRIECD